MFVGVAAAAVLVGVAASWPQVARTSYFETREVLSRAPSQVSRTWSPGCIVVEDDDANAAKTPSARKAAAPMTPGSSCRRTESTPTRIERITCTFGAQRETFERVSVTAP